MKLKNYTSAVSPERSVISIEKILVDIGATYIVKIYENSRLSGITFQIDYEGKPMLFKLPANEQAIEDIMKSEIKKPRENTQSRIEEQAQRTAWKLLLDWVSVQASMVLIGRRSVIEVFLPYAYNKQQNRTFYEYLQQSKFAMLQKENPL